MYGMFIVAMVLSAASLKAFAGESHHAEIISLKEKIAKVRDRITQLEAQQNAIDAAAPLPKPLSQEEVDKLCKTVIHEQKTGYIYIPALGTSIKPGGFIKANCIHNRHTSPTGSAYDFIYAPLIPLQGNTVNKRRGETHVSARQSMVSLETYTPTKHGAIETRCDADFLGLTEAGTEQVFNNYYLRLRHMYVQWKGWLFGQTDNTFRDLEAMPPTVDFEGPAGTAAFRQTELQYLLKLNEHVTWQFALGNPETDYTETNGVTATKRNSMNGLVTTQGFGLDQIPDILTHFKWKGEWGHLSLRGLTRELRIREGGIRQPLRQHGWGIGVSGHWQMTAGDKFMASYNVGSGIGRYNIEACGQSMVLDTRFNQLKPIMSWGIMTAYQHTWMPGLCSSLALGRTRVDNPPLLKMRGVEVNRDMRTLHCNLIWMPRPKLEFGVEVSRGYRKVEDGRHGRAQRYEVMAKYLF